MSSKKKTKQVIIDVVLPIISALGMLTIAIIAPNAVQIIGLGGRKYSLPRRSLRRSLRRMERQGYIRRLSSSRTAWDYQLTKKGKEFLNKKNIESMSLQKPKRWDKKWRVVIFDIPENLKKNRDAFRWRLRDLGFKYVNLSVWIYPYECYDEINALISFYEIGKYVRFMRVEYFDGIDKFKKEFSL